MAVLPVADLTQAQPIPVLATPIVHMDTLVGKLVLNLLPVDLPFVGLECRSRQLRQRRTPPGLPVGQKEHVLHPTQSSEGLRTPPFPVEYHRHRSLLPLLAQILNQTRY